MRLRKQLSSDLNLYLSSTRMTIYSIVESLLCLSKNLMIDSMVSSLVSSIGAARSPIHGRHTPSLKPIFTLYFFHETFFEYVMNTCEE